MPNAAGQPVMECTIELLDVTRRVWRRLLVPAGVRLGKLHWIFQAAMGWEDCHLHSFAIGEHRYGIQFDDYPEDELDEQAKTVDRAIGSHDRFTYEYDFGDGWEHDVIVTGMSQQPVGLKSAVCLDGGGACPPEDCGGSGGYAELLRVLGDPTDEDHADMSEWVGRPIDPDEFELALVNARLQAVR